MEIGKRIGYSLFSLIAFRQMANSGLAVFALWEEDDGSPTIKFSFLLPFPGRMSGFSARQGKKKHRMHFLHFFCPFARSVINFGWRNDDILVPGDFDDADGGLNDAVIIAIAFALVRMLIIFYHAFVDGNIFHVNDRVRSQIFFCFLYIFCVFFALRKNSNLKKIFFL